MPSSSLNISIVGNPCSVNMTNNDRSYVGVENVIASIKALTTSFLFVIYPRAIAAA